MSVAKTVQLSSGYPSQFWGDICHVPKQRGGGTDLVLHFMCLPSDANHLVPCHWGLAESRGGNSVELMVYDV